LHHPHDASPAAPERCGSGSSEVRLCGGALTHLGKGELLGLGLKEGVSVVFHGAFIRNLERQACDGRANGMAGDDALHGVGDLVFGHVHLFVLPPQVADDGAHGFRVLRVQASATAGQNSDKSVPYYI
jgi:hypothetical protein